MSSIRIQDHWLSTSQGRIYAKRWDPQEAGSVHAMVPVILFHDSLGCVELWRDFPAQLAQALQRPVIAYDRLGFGKSSAHPGRLDRQFIHQEAHAGFLAVREQLGIGAFVAFGHSVGGGMAVACAAAYADDCAALITESAQAFVEDRTLAGIRQAQAAFRQAGQRERLEKYHGDKAAWVLSAWIDTWLAPDFADWTLDDDLRRVRCPTLAMHGEHDEYGTARHPERIAALVQGRAACEILPGCGHVPHREQPAEVLAMVTRWLG